jgi:hypothetical protein
MKNPIYSKSFNLPRSHKGAKDAKKMLLYLPGSIDLFSATKAIKVQEYFIHIKVNHH